MAPSGRKSFQKSTVAVRQIKKLVRKRGPRMPKTKALTEPRRKRIQKVMIMYQNSPETYGSELMFGSEEWLGQFREALNSPPDARHSHSHADLIDIIDIKSWLIQEPGLFRRPREPTSTAGDEDFDSDFSTDSIQSQSTTSSRDRNEGTETSQEETSPSPLRTRSSRNVRVTERSVKNKRLPAKRGQGRPRKTRGTSSRRQESAAATSDSETEVAAPVHTRNKKQQRPNYRDASPIVDVEDDVPEETRRRTNRKVKRGNR